MRLYPSLCPHVFVRPGCVCVCVFGRAMAKHAGPRLPSVVECLCPCLNNIYECQRVTVTAFFSEVTQPAHSPCLWVETQSNTGLRFPMHAMLAFI